MCIRDRGYDDQQIMGFFYPVETFHIEPKEVRKEINAEVFNSGPDGFKKEITTEIISYQKATKDIDHLETGELIGRKGRRLKNLLPRFEEAGMTSIPVLEEEIIEKPSAETVSDPETGEVILAFNEEITEEKLVELRRICLLYTSPSPRDRTRSRMPSSA